MIKQCRIILKGLRQLSTDSDDVLCFLDNTTCFCRFDDYSQTFDYATYQREIHSLIHQLILDGYLLPYDRSEERFTITSKGLHPYRTTWDELKIFLFKSVFIPIVVSLVTTLITMAFCG